MKTKIKFLAMMLMGIMLSTNVWGDQITLNFEGTGTFPYNSDWTVTNGSAYTERTRDNVATTSCASSTSTNYQNLTITYNKKIEGIITSIHYYAAKTSGNSTETNMYLQTSSNKSTWSGAVSGTTYNLATASQTGWTEVNLTDLDIDLSAGGYIRLYKAGSSTAQRLVDDITITYTNTAGPNVSSSESSLAFGSVDTESDKALSTNVSGSSLTGNITLSITGTNAGMFSVSPTSLTQTDGTVAATAVTVTYTPTATGSHSATLNIESTGATTKTVSLTGTGVAPKTKHNVNWHVGGDINTVRVAEGDPVEFPENPETLVSCGEKVFTGWTNAPYENASVPPTYYKSATMATSDLNFYAVFADVSGNANEYVRVTGPSELEDGMSVVLVSNKFSTALTHTATPDLSYTSAPTESNSKITATDAMKWTLEKSDTKWLIKYGSNTIGAASLPSSGSSKAISFTSNYNTWTIGQSTYTANTLYVVQSDNVGLEAPSNSGNWVLYGAYVKSSEYCALKVYKANVSYSNYVTSCATYNVTWKVNNATYEAGGSTTAPGGGKVSALPTAPTPAGGCTGSTFMGWTDHEVLDGEAPTPLFKTVADAPAVTDDVTYHAVFADENE